ncbi:MAG: sugar transferase [Planctomycetes bacterium]|nr:sugar transferase [Planctomycetota bacterium]
MKRLFDLGVSLLALLMLWPVMLMIAVAIRVTSSGAAIFAQTRAGEHGRPFTIYKFRTMRIETEPYGASPQGAEDPRLTRMGQWLRETSLDELPQLFNVVKGDMSLVGPRPLYVSQMAEWNERQLKRLQVRPGLTGLAQTSGRGKLTIEQKLELDVQYTQTQSWMVDLQLLWRTVSQVFGRHSIYEIRYSESQVTRGIDHRE